MIFILGLVLAVAFAVFTTALFRLTSKITFILCLYLVAWASIVLGSEVLGVVQLLTPAAWIGYQLLLALAAWYAWRRAGKPSLPGPWHDFQWSAWRKIPAVIWLLILGVGMIYLLGAVTILIVPPNNYDSMTYHLARVGYWIQHNSILPWPTGNLRQTTSPMNAEFGLLWTIQLWGTDQLAGFVQWLAVPFSMAAIFGLARLLGANKTQGMFAGLVWATFPEIVYQSTATQNDLVTTAFVIMAVYLLVMGLKSGAKKMLLLSSLAMGLALGTKITVPFLLPGMALWLVLVWIQSGRIGFHRLLVWGLGSLAAFLLFGAFTYAQNILVYQAPIPLDEPEAGRIILSYSRGNMLASNLVIFAYQAIDPSGLPPVIANPLLDSKAQLLSRLFNKLGDPIGKAIRSQIMPSNVYYSAASPSEETAWFGPLAFLLLFPAGIYQAVQGVRRKDSLRLGLGLMAAGFWFIMSLMLSWSPYKGRYFVIAVTLLAPFAAFIYHPRRWLTPGLWILAACAVAIGGWVTLTNPAKPLIGPQAIWGKDPIQLRTITYPINEEIIRTVDSLVPSNATLALKLGTNGWDYPFFGPQFKRTLVQIDPYYSKAGYASLGDLKFDYLLVGPHQLNFLTPPEGLHLLAQVGKFELYGPPASASGTDPGVTVPNPFDSTHLVEVKPPLVGTVGVLEAWPNSEAWDIEQYEGDSFFWLGEGESQSLGFTIWSQQTVNTRIVLSVEPGPARSDTLRTLDFITVNRSNDRTTVTRTFNGPEQLEIPVTLLAGYNQFRIKCDNLASIKVQPNGDARPLLVMLRHISILPAGAP